MTQTLAAGGNIDVVNQTFGATVDQIISGQAQ